MDMVEYFFRLYKKEHKEFLISIREANTVNHRVWALIVLIIPIIVYAIPISLVLLLNIKDPYSINQILVNGGLPLVSIMILVTILTIDLSHNRKNSRYIKDIESTTRIMVIFVGIITVLLYETESISDRTDLFWVLFLLSLFLLIVSYFLATVYFMLQKSSIDKSERESRKFSEKSSAK